MFELHSAAQHGQLHICRHILQVSTRDLELRDCNGTTPLMHAVFAGHVAITELLHKKYGANLSTTDVDGNTLLHAAIESEQPDILAYLLRCDVDINTPNHILGASPLYMASGLGFTAMVRMLLEHGADPSGESLNGDLFAATYIGCADVVELLLRSGMQTAVTSRKFEGNTPLTLAVMRKHVAVVRMLLHNGADANQLDNRGTAVLQVAAVHKSVELVSLLLQHGAAANTATQSNGFTALLVAACKCDVPLIRLLLDAGADGLTASAQGVTVLHAAADNVEHSGVLQLLLQERVAAVHLNSLATMCDCCGAQTPLMACTRPVHVQLLLAAGADVHKTTSTGNTVLHTAAIHGAAAPVLCLMIKAGVDLHALNNAGKTAVQLADEHGNELVAALLRRAATGP
jgi:ankyrin repeat protein